MEDGSYVAVVTNVVSEGRYGPFAVAKSKDIKGSITFSLRRPVWRVKTWPKPDTHVILSALDRKSAGWRAMRARPMKPSDEQQSATSKEIKKEQ